MQPRSSHRPRTGSAPHPARLTVGLHRCACARYETVRASSASNATHPVVGYRIHRSDPPPTAAPNNQLKGQRWHVAKRRLRPPRSNPIWVRCRARQPHPAGTAASSHHHAPDRCPRKSWCSWVCAPVPVASLTGWFSEAWSWPLWHRPCCQNSTGNGSFLTARRHRHRPARYMKPWPCWPPGPQTA